MDHDETAKAQACSDHYLLASKTNNSGFASMCLNQHFGLYSKILSTKAIR